MSGIKRICNLNRERQDGLDLEPPACNSVLERYPIQKLHDDERLLSVPADFVDRADVGVIQCRGSTSLAPEAF